MYGSKIAFQLYNSASGGCCCSFSSCRGGANCSCPDFFINNLEFMDKINFSIEFAEIVLYFPTWICLQQKLLQLGWRIGSSSSKLQKQLLQPAASVLCPFVPLNPTSNQPLQPIWIFWVIDQPTLLQKGVEDSLKLFSICSNTRIRI